MYIIVGLGNPGKKYEQTRHNIGFISIDYMADKYGIKVSKIKHKALIGEGNIGNSKLILVKPQTYMNLSGEAVREIVDYYKADLSKLVVIYDDIDIPVGSVRIRKKGSSGTHNGMRSIIYQLKSEEFPRIRIGMGRNGSDELKDFVLGGFSKAEKPVLEAAVRHTADAVECFISEGIDVCMNRYNIKTV